MVGYMVAEMEYWLAVLKEFEMEIRLAEDLVRWMDAQFFELSVQKRVESSELGLVEKMVAGAASEMVGWLGNQKGEKKVGAKVL